MDMSVRHKVALGLGIIAEKRMLPGFFSISTIAEAANVSLDDTICALHMLETRGAAMGFDVEYVFDDEDDSIVYLDRVSS
jgi:hypothetical protein